MKRRQIIKLLCALPAALVVAARLPMPDLGTPGDGQPVPTVLHGPITWHDDQEVRRQMAQAMGDKLDEDILGALL